MSGKTKNRREWHEREGGREGERERETGRGGCGGKQLVAVR